MTIIARLPQNARPRYPQARFESAIFAAGIYDFNIPINQNVNFLQLRGQSVYVIDKFSFSAALPEGDWLSSTDVPVLQFPTFSLRKETMEGNNIYMEPIPALNYIDNGDTLLYFRAKQDLEFLQITFNGQLIQVPNTVGIPQLTTQVSALIYEVSYSDWTIFFEGDPKSKKMIELFA